MPFSTSRFKLFFCFTGTTLLLSATQAVPLNIRFANDIPTAQSDLMNQDIRLIRSLQVESSDPQLTSQITELFGAVRSGTDYESWLAQRAQVIVAENFTPDRNTIRVIREQHFFRNRELPEIEQGRTPPRGGRVKLVMSNLGAGIYFFGKSSGAILGLAIPGLNTITVNSPRAGIFQIGEGHFLPLLRRSGGTENNTYANSLMRLTTFFHEARHSDGNGPSLGFMHAVCPEGHDYAGYNACDANTNGPYTVGAVFLKSVIANCAACSEAEKEALRNAYTDSFSRMILSAEQINEANSPDALLRETCEILADLPGNGGAPGGSAGDLDPCERFAESPLDHHRRPSQPASWNANPEIESLQ